MGRTYRRLPFYVLDEAESIASLNCVCYVIDVRVFNVIFKVLTIIIIDIIRLVYPFACLKKWDIVLHIWKISTWEAGTTGLLIESQLWLHSKTPHQK